MIEVKNFVRLFERSAEAMKDAAQFSGVRLHNLERVIPRVALVNDYVKLKLDRQIELFLKKIGLFRFVSAIFNARFQLFFSSALQRAKHLHIFLFRCFDARQMMIIKTGLADRYYARTLCQLSQRRDHVLPRLFDTGRMNADYGVDARIFLREIDGAPTALD